MKYDASVIYVYYNTPRELVQSVNSVLVAKKKLSLQIIIVNNDSPKKIPKELLKNRKIVIINNKNSGYGAGLNVGVKSSKSEVLIFTNPDVVFFENSLHKLISKVKEKKIGIVGPQMLDSHGNILPTISGESDLKSLLFATSFVNTLFPKNRLSRDFWLTNVNRNKEKYVKIISGACMAIRRKVFEEVGGFDEQFFMYFEENDLCYRVRRVGYSILYYPSSKIFHAIGASSDDKTAIEEKFQISRFKFLKKYNPLWKAVAAESIFRTTTLSGLILSCALILSLFLNLYRINTHMLFIGDFGRDFLAARDMLLTGSVPLVGIPSSVVWLHQGPLSIYFIAFSFLVSNFNPVAPAIFYAFLGVGTVYLVYRLTTLLFGRTAGAFAALLYATSPLVVMSTRMPYHTSSIPFFITLLFLMIVKIMRGNRKIIPFTAFILGLLLLLELSNAVVLLIIGILLFLKKPKFTKKEIIVAFGFFLIGILPFIIYDITHRFTQTVGFPLWIINRIRLFMGIASPEKVTTGNIPEALIRIYQQVTGIVFPESQLVVILFIALFGYFIYSHRSEVLRLKNLNPVLLLLLWLFVPLVAFLIHAAPGVAYFPLLFPVVIISASLGIFAFYQKNRKYIFILFVVSFLNGFFLLTNSYYLATKENNRGLPPFNYQYGVAYSIQEDAVRKIVSDANGRDFMLKSGGFLGTLTTGLDNYTYLAWYFRGNVVEGSVLSYTIYEDINAVKDKNLLIFDNNFIFVEKNEDK
ncbi:MAG: glycosyltransferase [Candidatus Levybacteria bacterium]|nr:glycosyltransferase [Candidatus Levybacteria bacterium]